MTYHTGARVESGLLISLLEKLSLFCLMVRNSAAIDLKMYGSSLPSKLDRSSYIVSVTKTAFNKIGALIHSVNVRSSKVEFHLCKGSCIQYVRKIF